MGRLTKKIYPETDDVMQLHTQAGNINTNCKVKGGFTLPELSAADVMARNYHVDDSTKGRYGMILGRYL